MLGSSRKGTLPAVQSQIHFYSNKKAPAFPLVPLYVLAAGLLNALPAYID